MLLTFSLVIYFIHSINGVYMSAPVSQFIPPPYHPWCLYVCSLRLYLCFCLANEISCTIFHPTPVLLPGKSHGWRSLVGCGLWGLKESDTTAWLHFHFSLSCTREGNGNPLQCSCLENPRDGGAWWAAIYGVIQSQTQLKWLSSIPIF